MACSVAWRSPSEPAPASCLRSAEYSASFAAMLSTMPTNASSEFTPLPRSRANSAGRSIPSFLKSLAVSWLLILASRFTKLLPASSLLPATMTPACMLARMRRIPSIPLRPLSRPAAIVCGSHLAMSRSSNPPAWPAAIAMFSTSGI